MVPAFTTVGTGPRLAVVVHGILGSGRNWRGLAARLAERFPEWRFALPDLRNHGDSPPAAPPHTVAACAADLADLAGEIGVPELIVGHSFGGKVALVYARDHADGLRTAWALDSPPGRGEGGDTLGVLDAVEAARVPASDRQEVREFLRSRGVSEPVVAWLATSLAERGGRWVWKYDLPGVRAMIADYLALDLWPFVRSARERPGLRLVRAGRGDRWTAADLAECQDLPSSTRTFVLRDAGHWVHVDDPEGVIALIAQDLT